VVVTGAGLLLGRREITQGARYLGRSLGEMVGTLQGVRIKYEEKTSGSHIHTLHKNVKAGLQDMGTIGSDLASLGAGRVPRASMHSNLSSASMPLSSTRIMNSSTAVGSIGKQDRNHLDLVSTSTTTASHNIAKLILAENILNETRPVEGIKSFESISSARTGADLLQDAISESIISDYYASELKKHK